MLYVKFEHYPTYEEELDEEHWDDLGNMVVWFLFSFEEIEDITHIFYIYQ